MSTPNRSSKASQTRRLSIDRRTLTRVENWVLIPPAERAVLPVPSESLSQRVTSAPAAASACADESPTMPPPTTTTSILATLGRMME